MEGFLSNAVQIFVLLLCMAATLCSDTSSSETTVLRPHRRTSNPTCVQSSTCPIPGQQCIYDTLLNRRICACPTGDGYSAGENCMASCPKVDTSKFQGCKGGQCFAPCNYPVGECNYETGLCICPDGVLGANCTGRCLGGCTGHGTCELDIDGATGKCVCDAGYRSAHCSITCPGVPLFRACRGNGVCNADGKCSCRSGWRGSDCSIECPGGNFNPCSGHGVCSPAATCTCDWGYTGGQCQYTCPGLHGKPCGCASPADPGCRGKCLDDGRCACNGSYAGPNCGFECPGGAQNPCSGKGKCDQGGACTCDVGWTGPYCNVACPTNLTNSGKLEECSGHGRCELVGSESQCICNSNRNGFIQEYYGAFCQHAVYNIQTRIAFQNPNATIPDGGLGGSPVWPAVVIVLSSSGLVGLLISRRWTKIMRPKDITEEQVANEHTSIQQLFLSIDVDQSGNITRDELRKFMQREDASVTEDQVKGLFDLMDRNKDGTVSKKEFLYRYTLNRKRFMEVDVDHSGDVSFAELRAFMLKDDETATEEEIKVLFARMDKNKNGSVSKNEFTHFYSVFVTQKEDDKIRFAALDVDQSGNITRDELRKFMQREDASVTEDQVKGLFDLMDRNKDGTVSKKELLHRYILQKRRFVSVDVDHSGDVSFDELRAFVLKEDEVVTEEKIKLLFERMDRNKDGTVSKNEFSHFYSLFKTENFAAVNDRRQHRLSKIRSYE